MKMVIIGKDGCGYDGGGDDDYDEGGDVIAVLLWCRSKKSLWLGS